MGETAAERARRLARQMVNSTYGYIGRSNDDYDYEQWLNDVCREIIDEVDGETNPDVSLVKRYDKGSFKFV
jgi:hypothetical protein